MIPLALQLLISRMAALTPLGVFRVSPLGEVLLSSAGEDKLLPAVTAN